MHLQFKKSSNFGEETNNTQRIKNEYQMQKKNKKEKLYVYSRVKVFKGLYIKNDEIISNRLNTLVN